VSVVLANADEIRQLNSQFRGVDEVTDVLTFPAPPMVGGFLGDIAICVPYARTQAEARGIPFSDEIAYLALHGALHLAGFDDETEAERRVMQAEMARLGGLLGLSEEPQWSSILHEMEVAR
jgi:rRNA maturation RNase YbeY